MDDMAGGADADEADRAAGFDGAAFSARLAELNPWLRAPADARDALCRDATHARFAEGRDVWNAWAAAMLAARTQLETAGKWAAETDGFGSLESRNDVTRDWMTAARAQFSSTGQPHRFEDEADFSGFVFPGDARFDGAAFSGNARFRGAVFSGDAGFGEAAFSGDAGFRGAVFSGDAWFHGAVFSGDAGFRGAVFSGNARFVQARFKGYTIFDKAHFKSDARFTALQGESFFSLRDVTFDMPPDFEQAHFSEAPRLDISHFRRGHVQPGRFWGSRQRDVKGKSNTLSSAEETARWRALKRLASQGHDHEREQLFFARELRSLRGGTDWALPRPFNLFRRNAPLWQNGGRYWFGRFYQLFSDFGRSMVRPIFGWAVATVLFAGFYLSEHIARAGRVAFGSFWPWAFSGWHGWLKAIGAWPTVIDYPALARAVPGPPLACITGGADGSTPLSAALAVSLRKGLLFAGFGDSDKASQDYACLYGLDKQLMAEVNNQQLVRLVPDAVAYVGLVQTTFSAAMLFLFLLALRNQFRIR